MLTWINKTKSWKIKSVSQNKNFANSTISDAN